MQADRNGPNNFYKKNQLPIRDLIMLFGIPQPGVFFCCNQHEKDMFEKAHERKMNKYKDLVVDCQKQSWRVWHLPVEAGCCGFVGQVMWRALRIVGITATHRRQLIESLGREAEIASMWVRK